MVVQWLVWYKHLGQFGQLGGQQSAAQHPGNYVSIGHSSNGFSVMCMQGINLLSYITLTKSLKAVFISKLLINTVYVFILAVWNKQL